MLKYILTLTKKANVGYEPHEVMSREKSTVMIVCLSCFCFTFPGAVVEEDGGGVALLFSFPLIFLLSLLSLTSALMLFATMYTGCN